VEIDRVVQAAPERRRADRGREDLEVLAVGSVEANPDHLGDVAVEEGRASSDQRGHEVMMAAQCHDV
jgi:hypothetical protein